MKLVISLILNVIFAITLVVSLYFLRDEHDRSLIYQDRLQAAKRNLQISKSSLGKMHKEKDELKAELEKNIAARSRLKEMLAEARKSATKPTTLFSERTAKKPATKANVSQE